MIPPHAYACGYMIGVGMPNLCEAASKARWARLKSLERNVHKINNNLIIILYNIGYGN